MYKCQYKLINVILTLNISVNLQKYIVNQRTEINKLETLSQFRN